jgi:hypothetical protein
MPSSFDAIESSCFHLESDPLTHDHTASSRDARSVGLQLVRPLTIHSSRHSMGTSEAGVRTGNGGVGGSSGIYDLYRGSLESSKSPGRGVQCKGAFVVCVVLRVVQSRDKTKAVPMPRSTILHPNSIDCFLRMYHRRAGLSKRDLPGVPTFKRLLVR